MKILVIVDMQNDFIDGALSNVAAQKIVDPIAKYVSEFHGMVIFTQDTHYENYLETREGKNLPIPHCLLNSDGWKINKTIFNAAVENKKALVYGIQKETFSGGISLFKAIDRIYSNPKEIEICGTCTDICVINNALYLQSCFPETDIIIHKDMCAGLTKEKHEAAIEVMKSCQIQII